MQAPPRPTVVELGAVNRPALERHFLALDPADQRLRFGAVTSDAAVRAYVANIDLRRDALFGVFDERFELAGVAHLAVGTQNAELGISVLSAHRRRGIGAALLARGVLRARHLGLHGVFMHGLGENAAMARLARRQGMRIVNAHGEAQAWLDLSQTAIALSA